MPGSRHSDTFIFTPPHKVIPDKYILKCISSQKVGVTPLKRGKMSLNIRKVDLDPLDGYLSRLGLLHAVLCAGRPLAHFVSKKETQPRHQCVGGLIHRRRGAQLLAWLPCRGRWGRGGSGGRGKESKTVSVARKNKRAAHCHQKEKKTFSLVSTSCFCSTWNPTETRDPDIDTEHLPSEKQNKQTKKAPEFPHSSALCIINTFLNTPSGNL